MAPAARAPCHPPSLLMSDGGPGRRWLWKLKGPGQRCFLEHIRLGKRLRSGKEVRERAEAREPGQLQEGNQPDRHMNTRVRQEGQRGEGASESCLAPNKQRSSKCALPPVGPGYWARTLKTRPSRGTARDRTARCKQ